MISSNFEQKYGFNFLGGIRATETRTIEKESILLVCGHVCLETRLWFRFI